MALVIKNLPANAGVLKDVGLSPGSGGSPGGTSWLIDGEAMETLTDFILGGSRITADMKLKDACSLEEKL